MTNEEIKTKGQTYLMNTFNRGAICMVEGQGSYLKDADGKQYLDFLAGIAVNALGHNHPKVTAAIAEQAAKLVHCSNFYWIEPQVQLAEKLITNSVLDKV
ncbi:MAG: aminotransferase class III-fold pyridoxal phosphate-dependent enzyme, partial [Trichococcus flocculiformis]